MKSNNYFTEVPYSAGYFDAMNPSYLEFVLSLEGHNIVHPATACELGFGRGLSLVYHASAGHTEWHGTDLMEEHVRFARNMADIAGLPDNISSLDIASYANEPLPAFDFIALHGVWSWVSRATQIEIIKFIDARLKPGGLIYISYNILPGQAHILPFRELFYTTYTRVRPTCNDTYEAVAQSLSLIQSLANTNPRFFENTPGAKSHLQEIGKRSPTYLAHEYLNKEWNPTFFTTLYDLFSDIGVRHLCSSYPLDSISNVNLTNDQLREINATAGYADRELKRDFITNRQFRREYWVRSKSVRTKDEPLSGEILQRKIFQAVPDQRIKFKIQGDLGVIQLNKHLYTALFHELNNLSAPSLETLIHNLQNLSYPYGHIIEALKILLSCGYISILTSKEPSGNIDSRTRKLNDYLFERSKHETDVSHFVSRYTQGGIFVPRTHQLFIAEGLDPSSTGTIETRVSKLLSRNEEKIIRSGEPILGKQEEMRELEIQFKDFQEYYLPRYQAYGLVN